MPEEKADVTTQATAVPGPPVPVPGDAEPGRRTIGSLRVGGWLLCGVACALLPLGLELMFDWFSNGAASVVAVLEHGELLVVVALALASALAELVVNLAVGRRRLTGLKGLTLFVLIVLVVLTLLGYAALDSVGPALSDVLAAQAVVVVSVVGFACGLFAMILAQYE